MLNDARVASACLYVRTCQRVRNSKNIATIHDFQVHVPVNSTTNLGQGQDFAADAHEFEHAFNK